MSEVTSSSFFTLFEMTDRLSYDSLFYITLQIRQNSILFSSPNPGFLGLTKKSVIAGLTRNLIKKGHLILMRLRVKLAMTRAFFLLLVNSSIRKMKSRPTLHYYSI